MLTIRLVRRNNGVFEPEMRLWLLAGAMILLPCSLILWGVGAANGIHWFGILFGWGMMQFANTATIPITVNYMVDSYKDQSGDALVSMMLIRNSMGFAFTYAYVESESSPVLESFRLTRTESSLGLKEWASRTLLFHVRLFQWL